MAKIPKYSGIFGVFGVFFAILAIFQHSLHHGRTETFPFKSVIILQRFNSFGKGFTLEKKWERF